jgi:predicted SprT family Zn-dependent metalloprotease
MSVTKKNSTVLDTDKTLECMVCGKIFHRGMIDLSRHQAAVTLKHTFTEKKSSGFPFSCKKCSLYFSCKEHLDMHTKLSSCNPKVVKQRLDNQENAEDASEETGDSNSQLGSEDDSEEKEDDIDDVVDDGASAEVDKTVECLICGKTFHRGLLDLNRHAAAPTLKHSSSTKKTTSHSYGCQTCQVYFISKEHLNMHLVHASAHKPPEKKVPQDASSTAATKIKKSANVISGLPPLKIKKGYALVPADSSSTSSSHQDYGSSSPTATHQPADGEKLKSATDGSGSKTDAASHVRSDGRVRRTAAIAAAAAVSAASISTLAAAFNAKKVAAAQAEGKESLSAAESKLSAQIDTHSGEKSGAPAAAAAAAPSASATSAVSTAQRAGTMTMSRKRERDVAAAAAAASRRSSLKRTRILVPEGMYSNVTICHIVFVL